MKKLMMTTALVAVISTGAVAQTTTTTMDDATETSQAAVNVPAFLASDFTGKNLYTVDSESTRTLHDQRRAEGQDNWGRTSMRWESGQTFAADRDNWNDVGSIDDVVMTKDGEIRGVLIDVGGFLGIGARTVMVDIDELYFVSDEGSAEDLDDFFVVAAMAEDQLEALPEWDAAQLSTGFEARSYSGTTEPGDTMGHDGDVAEQEGRTDTLGTDAGVQAEVGTEAEPIDGELHTDARTEVPEGYQVMAAEDRTADRLLGADVYGREGDNIGTVDDLVMGQTGEVTHAVIDVGGFLGMGTHTVALELDDVDILWSDQDGNVRVQLPMTQEELESMPEHEG